MLLDKIKPKRLKGLSSEQYTALIKRCEVKWGNVLNIITPIINDVKNKGDDALVYYTKKFDNVTLTKDTLEVSQAEIDEALTEITDEQLKYLRQMIKNVRKFSSCNISTTWSKKFHNGESDLGKQITPLDKAGVYVPGGKYNYPTTAIMAIIPAKVAGVKEIIVVTPPKIGGKIPNITLAAIELAGAKKVFKVGGAQAIAALAYGTERIPKVDIIVGPGNIYVNFAKKWLNMVEGVRIDLPAGPSEILVIADNTAEPEFIAKDMISQAEHDENACAILVTNSKTIANDTYKKLLQIVDSKGMSVAIKSEMSVAIKSEMSVARKSLENYGAILLVDSLDEAIEFSNDFAPEHLEVMVKNPDELKEKIRHAGSIFFGKYSPVAAGDYNAGTNHILPTGGNAKRYSALSTETFQKISMFQKTSRAGLDRLRAGIRNLSKAEGLYDMHGLSVDARFQRKKNKKKKRK